MGDRISQLPEPIIHLIFSKLRCAKDVARTTVLSKDWGSFFQSYQSFDFDEKWFGYVNDRETMMRNFEDYVNGSVETRLHGVHRVERFRVFANDVDDSLMDSIGFWIRAAVDKNVSELDVQVCTETYYTPDIEIQIQIQIPVHDLTEANSVTFLTLGGNPSRSLAAMKMSNLRGLSLKMTIFVDEDVIKNVVETCPLLEDLRLYACLSLYRLQISSLVKLRRVEVQYCPRLERIEIASSNLESFWYHAYGEQMCKIDLKGSENLKNLTLKDRMIIDDSAFEEFIGMFPMLEKLTLHNCNAIEKLRICKVALKSLTLIQCEELVKVDVEAPNLYSFHYEGPVTSWPLKINVPSLSELKLSFKKSWLLRRPPNFSGSFEGNSGFLMVYTKQDMTISDGSMKWDIFKSDSCKIELTESLRKAVQTVDNWLRECHGKILEVKSSRGELLEAMKKLLVTEREDDLMCCASYKTKCWRHYIEDVEVSSFEIAAKTLFEFTWRSRKLRI